MGRYKEINKNNRSRFYILLSVIFVIVMFKWGVPFFMDVVAGDGAERAAQTKDIIPPQIPIISAIPEATHSAFVMVEGYTEGSSALDLLVNDKISVTDRSNADGSFLMRGNLETGSNRIQVRVADEAGNISISPVKLVVYDNKPVEITIMSPKDGSEFFGKTSQVIEIKGEVNKPEAQVTINNSFVSVDKLGVFVHKYQLSGGDNEIKVVAVDNAQNSAETSIKIVYTP